MTNPKRLTHIRTTSDKTKALGHYEELRASGRVKSAVVIAEMADGGYEVLGQGMSTDQIAQALVMAAEALAGVAAKGRELRPEAHQQPISSVPSGQPARKVKEITVAEDGTMVPPKGETIISCGECGHPRWFVLLHVANELPARFACGHCGNEIKMLPIHPRSGRA